MKDGTKQSFRRHAEGPVFLRDMQDFFAGRRHAHIANWRFSNPTHDGDIVRGNALWDAMEKRAKSTGLYYIYTDEIELIEKCFAHIGRALPDNITLIDLGPGPGESIRGKISPIINRLGPKIKRYVAVDLVPEILQQAQEIFEAEHPDIEFFRVSQDFYKTPLKLPKSGTRLSVIFGLTMFNIPIDPRIEGLPNKLLLDMLKRLNGNLRTGEFLAVTQDLNRDLSLMKSLYGEQEELWLNVLHRVKRDLPVSDDFDPTAFGYEVSWISKTNASVRSYVVKKDMEFMLGDEHFKLKSGQRFFLHNAFKPSAEEFVDIAKQAGLRQTHTATNDNGRMALHMFEHK